MSEYDTQQPRVFQAADGEATLSYLLYLPQGYGAESEKRWPLVLFLHGAGERGNAVEDVTRHGLPKLIKAGQQFPFIVVSPQCPPKTHWVDTDKLALLKGLLDEIERDYAVDHSRVYLTGLSMGGFGSWALAIDNPQRFAAVVPICGGGDPDGVCAIKEIPVWNFHGAEDDIVSVKRSDEMVTALLGCGGNVRYTIYAGVKHDSWTETYANPQLYSWLLEQHR